LEANVADAILADVVAVRSESLAKKLLERIFCRHCGLNSIPRPLDSTPSTQFFCRTCCQSLLRKRDPQSVAIIAQIGAEIDARFVRESFAGNTGDGARTALISTGRQL
jgi:hypothetical protein